MPPVPARAIRYSIVWSRQRGWQVKRGAEVISGHLSLEAAERAAYAAAAREQLDTGRATAVVVRPRPGG